MVLTQANLAEHNIYYWCSGASSAEPTRPPSIPFVCKWVDSNGLVESHHTIGLHTIRTISGVFLDELTFINLCFKPTTTVAAENLFLPRVCFP